MVMAHLLASRQVASKPFISLQFSGRQKIAPIALLGIVGLFGPACPGPGGATDETAIKKSNTRLELAKDFLGKRQLEAAETEASKALGFYPGNAEAHHVLGSIEFVRGLAAFHLLEIDDCMTGVDAEALRTEKDLHLNSALQHFARANELDPEYGESWASRGAVAALLGQYDRAVEYLTRALGLPARLDNIALVRANLGWAYFHQNRLVLAAKELLQASQFQPGMCVATYRLGRVYFARKEWEKALQKFRDVAGQKECPIQEAHFYLMKTITTMGMAEGQADALRDAEQACVALAPDSCVARQCRTLLDSGPGSSSSFLLHRLLGNRDG